MKTQNESINNEQAVIGSLLRNNDAFDEIVFLKTTDFVREDHRAIFAEISLILNTGKPVDLIILAESLEAKQQLERVGGLPYISALTQVINTTKNVKYHAKNVQSNSKRRAIKSLCTDLLELADSHEQVDTITEKAEASLFNLLENENDGLSHVSEAVAEAIDWNDTDHKGLDTGLLDLDRLTGGMNKSNLIIIAGRPSMGKSALAMQVAEHVAKKESVIIFSLEMSKREVAARFVKYHESIVGKSEAVKHLYSLHMHIDDKPAITIGHIRSQCRKIKRKHGLSMIVVDYIQLMQGQGDNRNQEIGGISRGLKSIAKEFDIPVIALSQLSRKVEERSDKRPIMSDLRESGEIEQDADLILFIYRDEVYDKHSDMSGYAEIICRKNRNGAVGDTITRFAGNVTRFLCNDGKSKNVIDMPRKPRGFVVGVD